MSFYNEEHHHIRGPGEWECSEVGNGILEMDVKGFFIRYRVTIMLAALTVLKLIASRINRVLPNLFAQSYPYLSHKTRNEIGVRCMQFLVGAYISLTGYAFLGFQLLSGCDVSELYSIAFGGIWLLSYETAEYVQHWPLPPALLVHHLAVMGMGLAVMDWKVLFVSGSSDTIAWPHACVLANIGATWVSDFFHVVYRTSPSLKTIETCRTLFLLLAVARVGNVALLLYMGAQSGSATAWAVMLLLTSVYAYITKRAVMFVYNFDCPKYFAGRNARWKKCGAVKEVVIPPLEEESCCQ